MNAKPKFQGAAKLAIILVASLAVGCGQVVIKGQPTGQEDNVQGTGTLSLATDEFPEGAKTLVLFIEQIDGGIDPCYGRVVSQPAVGIQEGLGLHAKPVDCVPVLYDATSKESLVTNGLSSGKRIITVKKGEVIAPVRLPAGTYSVNADFSDAHDQLLYTGSELFEIVANEKKSVTIHLKKFESGEVSIGFDVEKPDVLPTKISDDAVIELHRSGRLAKNANIAQHIDMDLLTGVAVFSSECFVGGKCLGAVRERKVTVNGARLEKIRSITRTVSLRKVKNLCSDPIEEISLLLKKCKECEAGKNYPFSNSGCGQAIHSLTSEQFEQIWNIVNSPVIAK